MIFNANFKQSIKLNLLSVQDTFAKVGEKRKYFSEMS